MICYVPALAPGVLMIEQTGLEDKFGGLPWGYPQDRWPVCRGCGKPISLVAQLRHHPERFDLGAEGRVLHIFMCDRNETAGYCQTWDPESGANAVIILEGSELGTGLTAPPTPDTPVLTECRVVGWQPVAERVTDEAVAAFYNMDEFSPQEWDLLEAIEQGTKLGGCPAWVQGPQEEVDYQRWRFVGQIGWGLTMAVPMPSPLPQGFERAEDGSAYCYPFNFGDAGTAYIFIRLGDKPEGRFYWQCG